MSHTVTFYTLMKLKDGDVEADFMKHINTVEMQNIKLSSLDCAVLSDCPETHPHTPVLTVLHSPSNEPQIVANSKPTLQSRGPNTHRLCAAALTQQRTCFTVSPLHSSQGPLDVPLHFPLYEPRIASNCGNDCVEMTEVYGNLICLNSSMLVLTSLCSALLSLLLAVCLVLSSSKWFCVSPLRAA